jgi:hypothetical protein
LPGYQTLSGIGCALSSAPENSAPGRNHTQGEHCLMVWLPKEPAPQIFLRQLPLTGIGHKALHRLAGGATHAQRQRAAKQRCPTKKSTIDNTPRQTGSSRECQLKACVVATSKHAPMSAIALSI